MKEKLKLDLPTLGAIALAVGTNTSPEVSHAVASNPDQVSAIIAIGMAIYRLFKNWRKK